MHSCQSVHTLKTVLLHTERNKNVFVVDFIFMKSFCKLGDAAGIECEAYATPQG